MTLIAQMEDRYLLNTVLYMDRRIAEVHQMQQVMSSAVYARAQRMLDEIERRGLTIELARRRGDVRELVKAVAAKHGK